MNSKIMNKCGIYVIENMDSYRGHSYRMKQFDSYSDHKTDLFSNVALQFGKAYRIQDLVFRSFDQYRTIIKYEFFRSTCFLA